MGAPVRTDDVVLTRDEIAAAASMETIVIPSMFEVLGDYPWLSWLRRQTGNPRLFAMRAVRAGTFVLAVWVYAPWESSLPIATELESFESPPTSLWPQDLLHPQVLVARLQPWRDHYAELRAKYEQKMRDEESIRLATLDERNSVSRFLRHQGLDHEALLLESGRTDWDGSQRNPDAIAEMTEMISEIARGRVTI